ncbi:MAG TPA: IPExxxVDY family protein [Flavobacteriaceae bacterium]|nr:IPExxxVDY family protein [Flavobacteriaceae bacterium]
MTTANTKLKLTADQTFGAFFNEAHLFGIIAPQKQYQLCWQINRLLGMNFRLNSELEALIKKKEKYCFFQIYEFTEPIRYTFHYIYGNHYKGEYLIPELKHIDYIWLLKGDFYQQEEINLLINDIRKLDGVQMVMHLQVSEIKSRANLII